MDPKKMKNERHEIHLQERLLEDCEYYLEKFPEAKKFIFLSNDNLNNKLNIKDYISALMESYDLSQTKKWKNSSFYNPKLEEKANEFIEFTKLSSKIYELEEVEKLSLNSVYGVFFDSLNFYRNHNLFFNQFSKIINEYIDGNCQGEIAHRVVGRSTQQWLSSAEYSDELINKFKSFNLSLSTNFKKIMNRNIDELSSEEKEYIKAKNALMKFSQIKSSVCSLMKVIYLI